MAATNFPIRSVWIRADASLEIGSGHIMRCLTLAKALQQKDVEVNFICRAFKGNMIAFIEQQGFEVKTLPLENIEHTTVDPANESTWLALPQHIDAKECAELMPPVAELLIVDHYGIDAQWHQLLRDKSHFIMVIDDLANRALDCDLLLDQTYRRQNSDYQPLLLKKNASLLCGSRYALLRSEFLAARIDHKNNKATKEASESKHILVFMGGSDASNQSLVALKALEQLQQKGVNLRCTLVLGSQYQHYQSIQDFQSDSDLDVDVKNQVHNMAELMAQSDIAIGAAGASSWERCSMGLPALVFVYANNQKDIAHQLEQASAIKIWQNASELKTYLADLIEQPKKLKKMKNACIDICDGKGSVRVVEAISKLAYDQRQKA